MTIEALKERIPDFAKDVRLNLSSLASDETLGEQTKYGLLVATAIATRNAEVIAAIEAEAAGKLSPAALGRGEIRRRDHGDEQRLLPLRASGLEQGLRHDAGAAADERDRQSRSRQGRFRAVVARGLGDQRLRHAASTATRRCCCRPACRRRRSRPRSVLPRSSSRSRWRSRPARPASPSRRSKSNGITNTPSTRHGRVRPGHPRL